MNILPIHVTALERLGYTEKEARFLYLVATHSGYFVARQFLAFAGLQSGQRMTHFSNKTQSKKHTRSHQMPGHGTVYHLFSRKVYHQIGPENLSNHRQHEIEYIDARIAMLDFVLENPGFSYLETEAQKVAYFNGELAVGLQHLSSRTYQRRRTAQPAVRYFVDRFPMFFQDENSTTPVVTFTFIQGLEASLTAFVHHLHDYLPLFRKLREFRFLYLARLDTHFARASELFHSLVRIPLEPNPSDDLLRYFAIRKAWDQRQYASLSEDDLIYRNLAKERFSSQRFEHFYHAWKVGRVAESHIRSQLTGSEIPHLAHFETQILKPYAPPEEVEGADHGHREKKGPVQKNTRLGGTSSGDGVSSTGPT